MDLRLRELALEEVGTSHAPSLAEQVNEQHVKDVWHRQQRESVHQEDKRAEDAPIDSPFDPHAVNVAHPAVIVKSASYHLHFVAPCVAPVVRRPNFRKLSAQFFLRRNHCAHATISALQPCEACAARQRRTNLYKTAANWHFVKLV